MSWRVANECADRRFGSAARKQIIMFLADKGQEFEIMRLLRKYCHRLQPDALAGVDTAGLLNGLQGQIGELVAMLEAGSDACVGDVVRFMRDNKLMSFDDRYSELVDLYAGTGIPRRL